MTVEERKEYDRAYYQAHKDKVKANKRAYYQTHKGERYAYQKAYNEADLNSQGKTKKSIRVKSQHYLNNHGTKIPGYQIHHCCTYDDHTKFIYCSKEMHLKIHAYLRDNHIAADSDHYEQIKHLLDETVVLYGI